MKWHWRGVLVALLAFTTNVAAEDSAPDSADGQVRLRVLSYNIHHGEGVNRKLNLTRIADVIKSVNPDIVALREVDQGTERTNEIDQVQLRHLW